MLPPTYVHYDKTPLMTNNRERDTITIRFCYYKWIIIGRISSIFIVDKEFLDINKKFYRKTKTLKWIFSTIYFVCNKRGGEGLRFSVLGLGLWLCTKQIFECWERRKLSEFISEISSTFSSVFGERATQKRER